MEHTSVGGFYGSAWGGRIISGIDRPPFAVAVATTNTNKEVM